MKRNFFIENLKRWAFIQYSMLISWVSLYWLAIGRTVGSLPLYGDANRLEREEALRLWTLGGAYKSNEEKVKGALMPGRYGRSCSAVT